MELFQLIHVPFVPQNESIMVSLTDVPNYLAIGKNASSHLLQAELAQCRTCGTYFLCPRADLRSGEKNCLVYLFEGNHTEVLSSCKFVYTKWRLTSRIVPFSKSILLFSTENGTATQTCGEEITSLPISINQSVIFDRNTNCEVRLGKETLLPSVQVRVDLGVLNNTLFNLNLTNIWTELGDSDKEHIRVALSTIHAITTDDLKAMTLRDDPFYFPAIALWLILALTALALSVYGVDYARVWMKRRAKRTERSRKRTDKDGRDTTEEPTDEVERVVEHEVE
jgi:hypothetical protein